MDKCNHGAVLKTSLAGVILATRKCFMCVCQRKVNATTVHIGASFERNGESQSIVDFDGYAFGLMDLPW